MQRIAIIEDDHAIQQLYKIKLSLEGYDVQVAFNGIEGLKICKTYCPDLILLDINMPEMCGDEMLKRMRETEWGSRIRVIILTNASKSEAPSSLRFLHVDRYIVKAHFTPNQVLEIVNELLA